MNITPVQLAERVEEWSKRLAPLGVAHWRIVSVTVTDSLDVDTQIGAVEVSDKYDDCYFYVREDFVENCSEDELDELIIHEWLHVAFRDLSQTLDSVETWMPAATYDDFRESRKREEEGVIDRVARTLLLFYKNAPL